MTTFDYEMIIAFNACCFIALGWHIETKINRFVTYVNAEFELMKNLFLTLKTKKEDENKNL